MEDITNTIIQKLCDIEKAENIRIIYACESGSRAWGFASPDSDYDVRFVYVRPLEYYLGLEEKKDFIESELNEIYDINGWDVTKLLKLLTKSNPVIFEWADSPIVYKSSSEWEKIKEILNMYFKPAKSMHHYVSMARNNVRTYFQGTEVNLKKYLYILRPVLACEWIMTKKVTPPTAFSKLVDGVLPKELLSSVDELLEAKKNASEKDKGSHILELDAYIEQKINESLAFLDRNKLVEKVNWNIVDEVFLKLIKGE